MKIAVVAYSYYSSDARVRRYTESLARDGNEVDCLALAEKYQPKEKNIRLILYPLTRKRRGKFWYAIEYLLFFFYTFLILTKNHFLRRYQIIHINNMPDFLVFAALIPKMFGAKIILDMHDPMPELYLSKYHVAENSLMVRFLKWLEKQSFQFADKILTANNSFKTIFLQRDKIPPQKISVILNCPDPKIFDPQPTASSSQPFTLFYMGTIEERFGLDIAVYAVPEIVQKIPQFQFIIIPKLEMEGEYFSNLQSQIFNLKLDKYIKILPPQPLEKIAEMLKQATIGVVLAKNGIFTENIFPVKLLEFIQMNVPVIATKTKILSHYFTRKQIYFLEKNTSQEFAQAVIKLFQDKRKRQTLAQNAKSYLKKYNWPGEEKKYLKIIQELLSSTRH